MNNECTTTIVCYHCYTPAVEAAAAAASRSMNGALDTIAFAAPPPHAFFGRAGTIKEKSSVPNHIRKKRIHRRRAGLGGGCRVAYRQPASLVLV